jgi:hypothetical protein
MKTRFLVLCLAVFAMFGALAPVAAHANAADKAYTQKLLPVFNQLVSAAQKVEQGGTAITHANFNTAAKRFAESLAIYKSAQSTVNGLHPTPAMNKVQHLVQLSVSSYITGVNFYLSGSNHKNASEISTGVKPYNQGTKYLNQAAAAIRAAKAG